MGVGGFVIIPVCHGLWVACGECKYETCIFKIETPQKSLPMKGSHRLVEIITLRNETSSAGVVQLSQSCDSVGIK